MKPNRPIGDGRYSARIDALMAEKGPHLLRCGILAQGRDIPNAVLPATDQGTNVPRGIQRIASLSPPVETFSGGANSIMHSPMLAKLTEGVTA